MAYRMLVTDLDYTCLNEEHEIPEGNIIAARRANEEGILFSVATGRGRVAAERHIMKLNPNLPVILQNGMNIFDFAKGSMIREHLVDVDVSIRAVRWGMDMGIIPVITIDQRHHVSKRGGPLVDELELLEGVPCVETGDLAGFLEARRDGVKVANVLYVCQPGERDAIAEAAKPVFPEIKVITSGPPFVEFLNKDASKGHALEELCELAGVDMADVVVIGDAENDAEMMKRAGMSYAVANAEEIVKRIASKVTSRDHNEAVLPEVLSDAFGIEV
ncbi:MAG: HAD hydrolase family protein [Firmicutes bacterium]|nr:HAD hydrolase family protein [Bacillota bacterium]